MDSLTQIVLGAACGEIALGKKIGNKALLFGAIGGTIPDLDVFIGNLFYSNTIDQLIFHRGFMHSIPFAILAAFGFGYLIHWLYNTGKRKDTTTRKDWIWLFLLSILTHPILDCFTPYGTQLFLPFSDYRIAFNNIAVADPLYTLPFLISLIVLMFYKRGSVKRNWWLKAGIYVSSAYMILTIMNKFYIDSVFKKSFKQAGIEYSRFTVQPSLLNNILWYGVAETDSDYKVGYYSILDKNSVATDFISVPKNQDLLDMNDIDLKKLTWFSNEYYNLTSLPDGEFRYNDLRYPLIQNNANSSSVFGFRLYKNGNRWEYKNDAERFKNTSPSELFSSIWERMKGK
ncbi:inner membrane protein [Tenacibaculum sp. 190524A05c]|uniref:metal-dependent hydrolase n=1 Tax=Tenacibaculum platacis TaxID=3137852 RepID=UPI0031FAC731